MLTRANKRDDGFTLIELVITVAILGVIAVVLIEMLFLYVRNANETNTRMNESSDQQFIAAFWQQDVSSLGVYGFTPGTPVSSLSQQSIWTTDGGAPGGVPSACSSITNTVIGFAWNDYQNANTSDSSLAWTTATANAAVYWTRSATNSNGTTQTQLWRTRCIGSASSSNLLGRYLVPAAQTPTQVACKASDGTSVACTSATPPAVVSLTISVHDYSQVDHPSAATGYTTTLIAERRQG